MKKMHTPFSAASLAAFIVLVLTLTASAVNAQEKPLTLLSPNAPGWVTVSWEHTGEGVHWFELYRQDPPYAKGEDVFLGKSWNRTDSVIDKNLTAGTTYNYTVCAVYVDHSTCADWKPVTTLLPPPPPSSPPAKTPPPSTATLAPPQITAKGTSERYVLVTWNTDSQFALKTVLVYRDGEEVFDLAAKLGAFVPSYTDSVPRVNTAYRYKACFVGLDGQRPCSAEVTATGRLIAPSPPADVVVTQDKNRGRAGDLTARVRTLATARWRNTEIPGQFITLEREDRIQLDRVRVGLAWVELARVSARTDPTDILADVTPQRGEVAAEPGRNYRVCAHVPALGPSGTVCTAARATPVLPLPSTRSADLNGLAERGETLAGEDPLAMELRDEQPEEAAKRGFHIGLAAAEGQTLPGPGKQMIHDSLAPAEQRGFSKAVSFSLERNRNSDLAARGAMVARSDSVVGDARTAQESAFYRLGFDIASGIFGNPALGALGNTATGPGSLKIRDALSDAARKGFDASVALHLSRDYVRD